MKSIKYKNIPLIGENVPDNYVVGEDNNAYRVLPDNNIVPVSHPDLSTQPSILPYRFGATPVYEVLSRVEKVEENKDVIIDGEIIDGMSYFIDDMADMEIMLKEQYGSLQDRPLITQAGPYISIIFTNNKICYIDKSSRCHGISSFLITGRGLDIEYYLSPIDSDLNVKVDKFKIYHLIEHQPIIDYTNLSLYLNDYKICYIPGIGYTIDEIKNLKLKDIPSGITPISAIAFNNDNCQPCKIAKRGNEWYIDEVIDFIPDFVKVQYIGKSDDYYYNVPSPKERYNHFIWKDSIIAKYLPYNSINDVYNEPLSYGRLFIDNAILHIDGFDTSIYAQDYNFNIISRYFSGDSKDNMEGYPFFESINNYTLNREYVFNLYPSHQFHTLYLQLVTFHRDEDDSLVPLYFDNLDGNPNLQILKIDIDFAKSGSDQISYELVDYTTLNDIFKD